MNKSTDKSTTPAPHRIPPPRLYTYFDAIIRHHSIRAAADSLNIASSALNRRILDLEQEIGTPLFDRLPTGVRLTAAGEVLATHIRKTLTDLKHTTEQLSTMQGQLRGHIAIGSAESAAINLLPLLLANFQTKYPGARFTLTIGTPQDLLTNLREDRVDLILTHENPPSTEASVITTARQPFCALMRNNHPLSHHKKLSLGDCEAYPIVLAQENLAARALIETALTNTTLTLRPVLTTNIFEVMNKYVRLTDAISFQFHLASHPIDGLTAIPLADRQLANTSLTLATRRNRKLNPTTTLFCEWLQNAMQQT